MYPSLARPLLSHHPSSYGKLRCLPVGQRTAIKLLSIACKNLHSEMAPRYLSDLISVAHPGRYNLLANLQAAVPTGIAGLLAL